MPVCQNIPHLIAYKPDTVRLLILTDPSVNKSVYTYHNHPYDTIVFKQGVTELFSKSFELLQLSDLTTYEAIDLPILSYIGQWQITVVIKSSDGQVSIKNGQPLPLDSYIGTNG